MSGSSKAESSKQFPSHKQSDRAIAEAEAELTAARSKRHGERVPVLERRFAGSEIRTERAYLQ